MKKWMKKLVKTGYILGHQVEKAGKNKIVLTAYSYWDGRVQNRHPNAKVWIIETKSDYHDFLGENV